MDKQFRLYVIKEHTCYWSEYGTMVGIVAENLGDAYCFLLEWNKANGDPDVPEEELRSLLTDATTFDIIGTDVEAGVNFQFIT